MSDIAAPKSAVFRPAFPSRHQNRLNGRMLPCRVQQASRHGLRALILLLLLRFANGRALRRMSTLTSHREGLESEKNERALLATASQLRSVQQMENGTQDDMFSNQSDAVLVSIEPFQLLYISNATTTDFNSNDNTGSTTSSTFLRSVDDCMLLLDLTRVHMSRLLARNNPLTFQKLNLFLAVRPDTNVDRNTVHQLSNGTTVAFTGTAQYSTRTITSMQSEDNVSHNMFDPGAANSSISNNVTERPLNTVNMKDLVFLCFLGDNATTYLNTLCAEGGNWNELVSVTLMNVQGDRMGYINGTMVSLDTNDMNQTNTDRGTISHTMDEEMSRMMYLGAVLVPALLMCLVCGVWISYAARNNVQWKNMNDPNNPVWHSQLRLHNLPVSSNTNSNKSSKRKMQQLDSEKPGPGLGSSSPLHQHEPTENNSDTSAVRTSDLRASSPSNSSNPGGDDSSSRDLYSVQVAVPSRDDDDDDSDVFVIKGYGTSLSSNLQNTRELSPQRKFPRSTNV